MRVLRLALCLLAAVVLGAGPVAAQQAPVGEKRIREILIVRQPIFAGKEDEHSKLERFVSRHHTLTRESVIRTELLFKEGDALDEQLLTATERALRRLKFLTKAKITAVPVDDEHVDVEVETRDGVAFIPGGSFQGGGGLAKVEAHLMHVNLMGRGKKAFLEGLYESDVGTTWKIGYTDPQIFGTQWLGTTSYRKGPLIESFLATARLPLYSPDSEWSYGATAYTEDKIIRLFEQGKEVSRIEKNRKYVKAFAARAFGERYEKTTVTAGLKYDEAEFFSLGSETNTPLPPDQANLTPSIGLKKESIEWIKTNYIDKMGIVEDRRVGFNVGTSVGYGIPVGDGFELWDIGALVSYDTAISDDQLLYLLASYTTEVYRNEIFHAHAQYYNKFKRHTFATNLVADFGFDLDTSRQFQLGAESGLRGYPAREFSGDKLALLNIEDRQFWGTLLGGMEIGTVVFVDSGNVWKRGQSVDFSDLNWSTGFGFRVGFWHIPHQPIFRLDFGWGIDEDTFAVTIGTEQHF